VGEDLDPEQVEAFLDAADIDPATYAADVKLLAKRLEWRTVADQLPALLREREENRLRVEQIDSQLARDLAAAHQRAREAAAPLGVRQLEVNAQIRSAEQALGQLDATAPAGHAERVAAARAKVELAQKELQRRGVLVDRFVKWEAEAQPDNLASNPLKNNHFEQQRVAQNAATAKEQGPAARAAYDEQLAVVRQASAIIRSTSAEARTP
jgi:hypothetical protein